MPNEVVIGTNNLISLPDVGPGSYGEGWWQIIVNTTTSYYSYGPTGGFNLSFSGEIIQSPFTQIVVDIAVPGGGVVAVGDSFQVLFMHKPSGSSQLHLFRGNVGVVCMTLALSLTGSSFNPEKLPGTNPQQYKYRYWARAKPKGGTPPYTYSWSTTVSGGTLSSYSATGDSCLLEVTTTDSSAGGITGTVSCTANDSAGCSASDSANISEAAPPTCHCDSPTPGDPASCPCQTCTPEQCQPGSGNLPIGSGDPNNYGGGSFGNMGGGGFGSLGGSLGNMGRGGGNGPSPGGVPSWGGRMVN